MSLNDRLAPGYRRGPRTPGRWSASPSRWRRRARMPQPWRQSRPASRRLPRGPTSGSMPAAGTHGFPAEGCRLVCCHAAVRSEFSAAFSRKTVALPSQNSHNCGSYLSYLQKHRALARIDWTPRVAALCADCRVAGQVRRGRAAGCTCTHTGGAQGSPFPVM